MTGKARNLLLGMIALAVASAAGAADIPNVIFDTDMWSDIDDALALAMLHTLQDRHEAKLVAVTVSTGSPWCASYVDLVDSFYGHPRIPVGLVHDGVPFQAFQEKFPDTHWPPTRYTEIIAQRKAANGAPLYPHHLVDGAKAPEAVSLLRKTLAAQPDGSVVMIATGYLTNLARLLDSKADAASPLDGRALIARKVRLLSVMAGNFGQTAALPKGAPEFNIVVDIEAARKVYAGWPTPIVDSGYEIGLNLKYPGAAIPDPAKNPIADTYVAYCEEMKATDPSIGKCPEGHDHPTFDLTAVLYAIRPDGGYFSLSAPGRIGIASDGASSFEESAAGTHRYLILDEQQRARTLNALVALVHAKAKS